MSKQKVLTSFFVVFYSIYGIKKIYFKFFWNFFEKSLDFINILWEYTLRNGKHLQVVDMI